MGEQLSKTESCAARSHTPRLIPRLASRRPASMEGSAASAQQAVLQPSEALPEGTPQIRGYDFNSGLDYNKLLESLLTTGAPLLVLSRVFFSLPMHAHCYFCFLLVHVFAHWRLQGFKQPALARQWKRSTACSGGGFQTSAHCTPVCSFPVRVVESMYNISC